MNNAPFSYELNNICNTLYNPSGITISNTETARFFRRYLLQKAVSVFTWEFPDDWNEQYFLYSLYIKGHIAVLETDKYGVICQNGIPNGLNLFYQPSNYQIANPLLKGLTNPKIDKECTVFKMTKDWRGIGDVIAFYADYMAVVAQSLGVNLVNSKLSYIFAAENKAAAETLKRAMDDVNSGKPATFVDSKLFGNDGNLKVALLQHNVGGNFIAEDLLNAWTVLENKFATTIGIPNANTDKKERLLVDEVNANNVETATLCDMWYNGWLNTIEKTRAMFPGLEKLSVKWRFNPFGNGGVNDNDNGENVNSRFV